MNVTVARLIIVPGTIAALAILACGDAPFGVNAARSVRIEVGDTITAVVEGGGAVRVYSFVAIEDSVYAVFLQSLRAAARAVVRESLSLQTIGVVFADPSVGSLDDRATLPFTVSSGNPALVTVESYHPDSTTQFRLTVQLMHRGPETAPRRIALGDTIEESLYSLADVDDFTFIAPAGQDVIGFLQAVLPASHQQMYMTVRSPDGSLALAYAISSAGDSALGRETTGRVLLPVAGEYHAVLAALGDPWLDDRSFRGLYRFQIQPIDRGPEDRGAAMTLNDTVAGEAVDYVGDIDEFTFATPAGQQVVVFLQALSGNVMDSIGVEVPGAAPALGRVYPLISGGTDASLLTQHLGPLTFPGGGTQMVRVLGVWDRFHNDGGPYRIHVYPVNPSPETAPDTLALNDSLTLEAVDYPGDVDSFFVSVPADTQGNLVLRVDEEAGGGPLVVVLRNVTTGTYTGLVLPTDTPGYHVTGPGELRGGAYAVEVSGAGLGISRAVGFRGGYGLQLFAFGGGPEAAADTIAVGDTVTEAIDLPGDRDVFVAFLERGQHRNIRFQGLGASDSGALGLDLLPPVGGYGVIGVVGSTATASLDHRQSNRYDVPVTGWYQLRVGSSGRLSDRGTYRFLIEAVNTAPESAQAALIPGDTVAERLDRLGDIDEFELRGTPGQELAALFEGAPLLEVYDSATADTVRSAYGLAGLRATGRFRLPASGAVTIRVLEQRIGGGLCSDSVCTGAFQHTVAYGFVVHPVNRSPETVAASLASGDTLRGEFIYPIADVDEFALTAAAGDTVIVAFRLLDPVVPSQRTLVAEVLDLSGVVVASIAQTVPPPPAVWGVMGPVLVPSGGLRVRVRGGSDTEGTAPYELTAHVR